MSGDRSQLMVLQLHRGMNRVVTDARRVTPPSCFTTTRLTSSSCFSRDFHERTSTKRNTRLPAVSGPPCHGAVWILKDGFSWGGIDSPLGRALLAGQALSWRCDIRSR